jgi:Tfp pilus assembly protein PilZ
LESHSTDKRSFRRHSLKEAVRVQFKDPTETVGSLSCDISEGGVKISCNDFIPLGTEVELQVKLSDLQVVYCTGCVVWIQKVPHCDRYQAGLEFTDDSLIFDARSRIHFYFTEDE